MFVILLSISLVLVLALSIVSIFIFRHYKVTLLGWKWGDHKGVLYGCGAVKVWLCFDISNQFQGIFKLINFPIIGVQAGNGQRV